MKGKILLAIACCLGSLYSQAQLKLDTIFDKRQQIIAIGKLKEGQPHGKWNYYYPSGKLSESGRLVAGKRVGKWQAFFDDQTLQSVKYYQNGQLNGKYQVYHTNGKLKEIARYQADSLEGMVAIYHKNGQLRQEQHWLAGQQVGLCTTYYDNGALLRIDSFANGLREGTTTLYHLNGQRYIQGCYEKGKRQGAWIEWDMSNRVSQVDSFLNGQKHGVQYQFYYQNAARKMGSVITCDYVHGKKQGLYQVYYDLEQKNLKEIIAYEADTVGTLWKTYHQYNQLKTERIYINRAKNTYLLKTYEYIGRNNFLTEASHYKNDTLHGTSIQYWLMKDDQIRRRATYVNGRLDGKLEVFGKDGTLEWEAVYVLGELIEKKDYKKTVNQYKGSDYSGYR